MDVVGVGDVLYICESYGYAFDEQVGFVVGGTVLSLLVLLEESAGYEEGTVGAELEDLLL
jgi:hypothetical protein